MFILIGESLLKLIISIGPLFLILAFVGPIILFIIFPIRVVFIAYAHFKSGEKEIYDKELNKRAMFFMFVLIYAILEFIVAAARAGVGGGTVTAFLLPSWSVVPLILYYNFEKYRTKAFTSVRNKTVGEQN